MNRDLCLLPYNLIQLLAAPALAPPFLLYQLARKKYRGHLAERLTFRLAKPVPKGQGPVWIHALSFGEVNAAAPLATALARRLGADSPIHLTASTATGRRAMSELAGRIGASFGVLPFDILPLVDRALSRIRPRLFVLVETDIWPNLIWRLDKRRVPALLVNGSISERAASRLRRIPGLASCLYGGFSFMAMQSAQDADRLVSLGLPADKVASFGNLKFDMEVEPLSSRQAEEMRKGLGFSETDFILVCGSTHPGEEEVILQAVLPVLEKGPGMRLVVAPRQPDRASQVAEIFRQAGLETGLLSASRSGSGPFRGRVLVVDTLGELMGLYGIADAAFVGGSLVPVGGHNLLEPAALGVPVLFGPYVESIEEAAEALKAAGGGIQVDGDRALQGVVASLLEDPEKRAKIGLAARSVVDDNRGVTDRYVRLVLRHLGKGAAA